MGQSLKGGLKTSSTKLFIQVHIDLAGAAMSLMIPTAHQWRKSSIHLTQRALFVDLMVFFLYLPLPSNFPKSHENIHQIWLGGREASSPTKEEEKESARRVASTERGVVPVHVNHPCSIVFPILHLKVKSPDFPIINITSEMIGYICRRRVITRKYVSVQL